MKTYVVQVEGHRIKISAEDYEFDAAEKTLFFTVGDNSVAGFPTEKLLYFTEESALVKEPAIRPVRA